MSFSTLSVDRRDHGVALVTLRRPERLNAMNAAMFTELLAAATELGRDDAVRAIVITGEGRGFSPGFDLTEAPGLAELSVHEMQRFQELAAEAIIAWHHIPTPVIAALNGPTVGGGLSLALASDIRMASTAATLSAIFVRGGFSAGDLGASWFLPRIVGLGRAGELMLSARIIDADEALRIGLVTSVHEPDALVDDALAAASDIAGLSPMAVRMSLRSLYANVDAPSLRAAIELENRGQTIMSPGPDGVEARAAKAEGRAPVFPD